jgi:hypothetical protein
MGTVAKTNKADSSHWYYTDGRSCYELPKKDGSGMKVPTLADARKLNLLPSVTTILKVLHKQALVEWLIEQACLAVLTSPRHDGEALDAFVYRVLHMEKVQDQESNAARDRGTELHAALELMFEGRGSEVSSDLIPWVEPAFKAVSALGPTIATERVVVGDGYAGKVDLVQSGLSSVWLWDWKTTKKVPDKAWSEHRLQLSAYAKAYSQISGSPINVGNVYISTIEQGKFSICEHDQWMQTYEIGFAPLVEHWKWATGYSPKPETHPNQID